MKAARLSAGVAAPCCVVTMSLVLSDSVTAALQSSMRRWTTVLTTCIWIGFKVSYAPLTVPGLSALRVFWLYIHPPSSSHMVSANHCPAVSLLLLTSLSLSVSSSLYHSWISLVSNSKGVVLQSCKIVVFSRPGGKKLRGSSYGLGPMLAGRGPWSYRVKAAKQKRWLSGAM